MDNIEAFEPTAPSWTNNATHSLQFCCPSCRESAAKSQRVWINRYAPVITEDYQRRWQEFYQCECGKAWWAWSSDRPPSNLKKTPES
jgi:hypothetical protein